MTQDLRVKILQACLKKFDEEMAAVFLAGEREGPKQETGLPWRLPAPLPRFLYIETATIRPAPGETGIYALSEVHFPGTRVWLGPPRQHLPPEILQIVDVMCDVLPLNATIEERQRLMNTYWPVASAQETMLSGLTTGTGQEWAASFWSLK